MTPPTPSPRANKRLIRELFDAYNDHDLDRFVALYTDDAYIHGAGEDFDGRDGIRSFAHGQFEAFPDGTYRIEDLVAEDDRVAVRKTFTGTHEGTFFGVAPTGRVLTVTEIAMFRTRGGKIAEMWLEADLWGMFQQVDAGGPPGE